MDAGQIALTIIAVVGVSAVVIVVGGIILTAWASMWHT